MGIKELTDLVEGMEQAGEEGNINLLYDLDKKYDEILDETLGNVYLERGEICNQKYGEQFGKIINLNKKYHQIVSENSRHLMEKMAEEIIGGKFGDNK